MSISSSLEYHSMFVCVCMCIKTSLVIRYVEKKFDEAYLNTIGIDVKYIFLTLKGIMHRDMHNARISVHAHTYIHTYIHTVLPSNCTVCMYVGVSVYIVCICVCVFRLKSRLMPHSVFDVTHTIIHSCNYTLNSYTHSYSYR